MSEGGNPWTFHGSAHAARKAGPSAAEAAEAAHKQLVEQHAAAMKQWEAEQARLDDEELELQRRQAEGEAAAAPSTEPVAVEEDPFNLGSLMEAPPPPPPSRVAKRRAPPPAPPPPRSSFVAAAAAAVTLTSAWDSVETGCMRREAVIQVGAYVSQVGE